MAVAERAILSGRRPILFQWTLSSYSGWGVYGINLMLHWASDTVFIPVCSTPFFEQEVILNDEQRSGIAEILKLSQSFQRQLEAFADKVVQCSHVVLHSLGNALCAVRSAHNSLLFGQPTIGVVFLEETALGDDARERAARYRLLIAGSRWCADVLEHSNIKPVSTVLQGVDTELFRPGPRGGKFKHRFVVFSGGKLEYRKAQDLVLLAFRAFVMRHPEAMLLTVWHNPWYNSKDMGRGRLSPPPLQQDGKPDIRTWALQSGVPAESFIDLGLIPNREVASWLHEVDLAIFPNRCEGGTNLVAMECMACGVPTILAANTGQLDLIRNGNCLPLNRQQPVTDTTGKGTQGWRESDVEEMIESMEVIWQSRQAAHEIGAHAANFMRALSWKQQIGKLKETLVPYID